MEATGVTAEAATGAENFENSENRGYILAKCWLQGSDWLNPPMHAYVHRGGGGCLGALIEPPGQGTSPEKFAQVANRG